MGWSRWSGYAERGPLLSTKSPRDLSAVSVGVCAYGCVCQCYRYLSNPIGCRCCSQCMCVCAVAGAPLTGRDDEMMAFLRSVQTHTHTSWLRIAGTPNAVRSTAAQPRPGCSCRKKAARASCKRNVSSPSHVLSGSAALAR